MTDFRNCYVCGWEGETAEKICPRCRKPIYRKLQFRILGAVLMIFGGILIGTMLSAIAFTNNVISREGNYKALIIFNAAPEKTELTYMIFYLGSAFSLSVFLAGVWHLATGKRNLNLIWQIFVAALILWIAANAVTRFIS